MNSYPCPYCGYPITEENVLFKYTTHQTRYQDMRRFAFYKLCASNWALEHENFDGLYFLPTDAQDEQIKREADGFPLVIHAKPCMGRTPNELEQLEIPGEPLSNFVAQYRNRQSLSTEVNSETAIPFPAEAASMSAFVDASPAQHAAREIKPQDDGVVEAISTRACPNCHNELHQRFGQIPTINVTLLGGPSAGKTAYLLSLTHQLKAQLSAHDLGTAELIKASQRYFEHLDLGYQKYQTTEATRRDEKLFPFVFYYADTRRGKECFIKFFDIAGESANDGNALLNHRGTMEASTLLMLLDPNQLNQGTFYAIKSSATGVEDEQEQNKVEYFRDDIESFSQSAITNNINQGAFQNIKHVIAVFSKMDLVLEANRELYGAGRADEGKIRFDLGRDHRGALDIAVINRIMAEMNTIINRTLEKPNYDLRGYLRSLFIGRKVDTLLLGVSTYTLVDPVNIVFENRCKPDASRHRIIEPFLCILAQNGMIPIQKPVAQQGPTEPPPAKAGVRKGWFSRRS